MDKLVRESVEERDTVVEELRVELEAVMVELVKITTILLVDEDLVLVLLICS